MREIFESYTITGKRLSYRPDNEVITLAEISIDDSGFDIVLRGSLSEPVRCRSEIWDHTPYEFEKLSAGLRAAAAGPFPPPIPVPSGDPEGGETINLSPALWVELGYSLKNHSAPRVSFYCFSLALWRRWGSHIVFLGVASQGALLEVALEPKQATDLADWLDRQIKWIYSADDEGEEEPAEN
jgi:hypothetical protein